MRWNMQKNVKKNIPNIVDCNSKHDYQISIIFGKNISDKYISDTTGYEIAV